MLPQLLQEIKRAFPLKTIFTPPELKHQFNNTWPSIDALSSLGKRVVFVTGYDYGPGIDAIMFSKYVACRPSEEHKPDVPAFWGQLIQFLLTSMVFSFFALLM